MSKHVETPHEHAAPLPASQHLQAEPIFPQFGHFLPGAGFPFAGAVLFGATFFFAAISRSFLVCGFEVSAPSNVHELGWATRTPGGQHTTSPHR